VPSHKFFKTWQFSAYPLLLRSSVVATRAMGAGFEPIVEPSSFALFTACLPARAMFAGLGDMDVWVLSACLYSGQNC